MNEHFFSPLFLASVTYVQVTMQNFDERKSEYSAEGVSA